MEENPYAQVHQVPDGYVVTTYTYDGIVPWLDIGRVAIYLLSFAVFFIIFMNLFRLI